MSLLRAYRTAAENVLAAFDTRIAKIRPSSSHLNTLAANASQEQAWFERVVSVINEEFNTVKSQVHELNDIEQILENPLVMVSGIPLETEPTS